MSAKRRKAEKSPRGYGYGTKARPPLPPSKAVPAKPPQRVNVPPRLEPRP